MNLRNDENTLSLLPGGRYMVVDLATERWEVHDIDAAILREFPGGRGLALKLWERYADDTVTDPSRYEAGNPVVIACGLLTNTSTPCGDLFSIVTRSPATGRMTVGISSASFGPALKAAGYSALVIRGRSRRPVIMQIETDGMSVMNSERFIGYSTTRISDLMTRDPYDCVLAIGPAGEQRVPYASVVCDGTSIGRGGIGTVFGFKNIKAVIVNGNPAIPFEPAVQPRSEEPDVPQPVQDSDGHAVASEAPAVAVASSPQTDIVPGVSSALPSVAPSEDDRESESVSAGQGHDAAVSERQVPEAGSEMAGDIAKIAKLRKKLANINDVSPMARRLRSEGEVTLMAEANAAGWIPISNFSLRTDPRTFYLGGAEQRRRHGDCYNSCSSCSLSCYHAVVDTNGKVETLLPQYEAMAMLGANLGIYDPVKVQRLLNACVEDGVDPVSMGNILGWAMVSRRHGLLCQIPDIEHGGVDVMVKVIDAASYRKGSGEILGIGLEALVGMFGGADWAYLVGGLEMGPYDVRGAFGQGLYEAIGTDVPFLPEVVVPRLNGAPAHVMARWAVFNEDICYALESLGICPMFASMVLYEGFVSNRSLRHRRIAGLLMRHVRRPCRLASPKLFVSLLRALFGGKLTSAQFLALGTNVWKLQMDLDERMGGFRFGSGALPDYFQINPESNHPQDRVVPLRPLLEAYWALRS